MGGRPSCVVENTGEASTTVSGRPAAASSASNETARNALSMAVAAFAEVERMVMVSRVLAAATSTLIASGATPGSAAAKRTAKEAVTFGVKSATSPDVTS